MSVVKNFLGKKAYYKPQGFFDTSMAAELITPNDVMLFEKKNITCVMIDFSKVVYVNMKSLNIINTMFEILFKKDIECAIFDANDQVYQIISRMKNTFFHYFENNRIRKLFCEEDYQEPLPILISPKIDEHYRDMLIYYLLKKGYSPKVGKKEECQSCVYIEKSFINKLTNRVSGQVRKNVVFFYFEGYLDRDLQSKFDLEYFRRSLLVGFRVFVFDMSNVKGMNIHAVNFLLKLGVEAAEYSALLAIIGLKTKYVQKKLISDLEFVNYYFFETLEQLYNSEVFKESINNIEKVFKKTKITKNFVKLLPFFVNATISTIELMTGVQAMKEPPKIKEVTIDLDRSDYVASSIGFYGDNDGVMILIFTKDLAKRISYILIGEELQSEEDLVDMLGEFANIILGNVKRELEKHDVKINLTLPKLFDDIQNLKNLVEHRKGIEVKFYFDGEEFYFYLIK